MASSGEVGAVVLAAGKSSRMGTPKMTLPWGETTVIAHIVDTLREAGVFDIVVVTGPAHDAVESALAGRKAADPRLVTIFNPHSTQYEMLVSLQVGARQLSAMESCRALLVVLGDQPTIESGVIRAAIETYAETGSPLVVPSYQMRRGHPWLVARTFWETLLAQTPDSTLRAFLSLHEREIRYVEVTSPGVLKDMDTPEDYRRLAEDHPPR